MDRDIVFDIAHNTGGPANSYATFNVENTSGETIKDWHVKIMHSKTLFSSDRVIEYLDYDTGSLTDPVWSDAIVTQESNSDIPVLDLSGGPGLKHSKRVTFKIYFEPSTLSTNKITLQYQPTVGDVPIPGAACLFGSALIGAAGVRQKKRRIQPRSA